MPDEIIKLEDMVDVVRADVEGGRTRREVTYVFMVDKDWDNRPVNHKPLAYSRIQGEALMERLFDLSLGKTIVDFDRIMCGPGYGKEFRNTVQTYGLATSPSDKHDTNITPELVELLYRAVTGEKP